MAVSSKKDKTITLRINEKDCDLLQYLAKKYGLSLGKYIRLCLDKPLQAIKVDIAKGIISYEDIKTFLNDKL